MAGPRGIERQRAVHFYNSSCDPMSKLIYKKQFDQFDQQKLFCQSLRQADPDVSIIPYIQPDVVRIGSCATAYEPSVKVFVKSEKEQFFALLVCVFVMGKGTCGRVAMCSLAPNDIQSEVGAKVFINKEVRVIMHVYVLLACPRNTD
jgi:hypothetical protein